MSDWGISAFYDGSFGSAQFWVQDPAPRPTRDEVIGDYHHDGSDDNTVVAFGRRSRTLELTVACNATDAAALETAQGTSATLDYPALASSITALLKTATPTQHEHFTAIYEVRLSFII